MSVGANSGRISLHNRRLPLIRPLRGEIAQWEPHLGTPPLASSYAQRFVPAAEWEADLRGSVAAMAAALLALFPIGAWAQSTAPAQLQPIEDRISAAVAAGDVPSVSIAVIQHGRVVWMHSGGWADIAARRAATPDTIYRVGSVSKSITSTVASIAASRGDVDLARPVVRYLPVLSRRFRNVSLADAINMSAGMTQAVYYRGSPDDVLGISPGQFSNGYAIRVANGEGLYAYSNMGPDLAARAISAATGEPFSSYARRTLFGPLGMTSTFLTFNEAPPDARATSYRRNLTPFEREYEVLPGAGAGMVASVRDLTAFALLHLGADTRARELLSPEVLLELHGAPTAGVYGYGWGRIGAGDFEALLSDGQVNGGQATLLLAPGQRSGVIVVSNAATDLVDELAVAALDALSPGFSDAFQRNAGDLMARLARNEAAFYPPDGRWAARGYVLIDGRRIRLDVSRADQGIELSIGSGPLLAGTPLEPERGFARWSLPCSSLFPECAPDTAADLTLSLTNGDERWLDGSLSVDSRLGLFPHEVHVRRARG